MLCTYVRYNLHICCFDAGWYMKSKIPEDILNLRPEKCCRLRKDGDIYRVYKYHSVKLPSGKWGANGGIYIGKIVPGIGFIANKRYLTELEIRKCTDQSQINDIVLESEKLTDLSYGIYSFLENTSNDVYTNLCKCFQVDVATQIYVYSLILCANGFMHIDQINEEFQESYLSVKHKKLGLKMGYAALSKLLHDLGAKGNPVTRFQQILIDNSSKNIAIDGHVIRSCSQENDLAEPGYKMSLLKADQVNLLIAFDVKTNLPLIYKTYRGSSVDKRSVLDFLEAQKFENTKFMVDRGFFSEDVLKLMSTNGNCYVIPLAVNNSNFTRIKETLEYSSGEFVYKDNTKNSARVVYYEENLDDNTRIIIYKDLDENNSKRKSYLHNLGLGESGYTQKKYDEYCEWWGVIPIQTTAKGPAFEIYNDFKSRWSIETFNNYIKNYARFVNLKIQDYYIEKGFNFIMLVTGLLHAKLNNLVKSLNNPNLSTYDMLVKARHIRIVHYPSGWKLHNTRTKDLELFKTLNWVPPVSINLD